MTDKIEGMVIENFLSHKHTELEFHEGVNVFIGDSDAGKSAIMKAINWCVNNKPSGDEYRSDWGGSTIVDMILSGGYTVTREKSRKNLYIISSNKGVQPEEFAAFGFGVPVEVQQLFNMNELNFQFQTDRHFLLSETSGEVARFINKIAKLEEIDVGLKSAERFKHNINIDIKTLTQMEAEVEEELKEYDDIDELEEKAEKLSFLCAEAEVLEKEVNILTGHIEEWEEVNTAIKELSFDVEKAAKSLDKLSSLQKEVEALDNDITELEDLIGDYYYFEDKLAEYNHVLQFEKKFAKLNGLDDEIKKESDEIYELEELVSSWSEYETQLSLAEEEYTELITERENLMPDICPLCGQKIPQ